MALRKRLRLLLVALFEGCCLAVPSHAVAGPLGSAEQNHNQPRTLPVGESEGGDGFEPIIVTARRYEEDLQNTPVSILSLSSNDIEAHSLTNLRDLQNFVPNVTFAPSQNVGDAAGNFFIRGIGQEDFLSGAEPGIGFYLDGVYLARTMGTLIDLIDIARIEVLRGPQGTLYGKNTIGGAINVISAVPVREAEGSASLIAGNLGRFELRAMANAPLDDRLAVRLAGGRTLRGGYLKRLAPAAAPTAISETDHRAEGRNDSLAGRLQLRWLASESLTVDLAADASRRRGTQGATHVDAIDPRFGILPTVNRLIREGKLPGPEITATLVPADWLTSFAGGGNSIAQDGEGLAATATKVVGGRRIELILAYRGLRSHVATDIDGSPLTIVQGDFAERFRQYSAELRGSGSLGRLTYTAGLFGLRERSQSSSVRGVGRIDVLYLCGCFYTPANRPRAFYPRRELGGDSYAAYAQASLRIADRLSATLGGRFSHERKFIHVDLVRLVPDTLEPTDVVDATGSNRGYWDAFTWRAGLEFQAAPGLMLYGSAAKGYKSGGFNGRPVANLANLGLTGFAPETAVTYEAGLRSQWLDRRLRINATLFHTAYRDIQLRRQSFVDGVLSTLIENAARARIRGVEFEVTAKPAQGVNTSLAYGYIDARYLDTGGAAGLTLDSAFQRTPRHSLSASAGYEIPLAFGAIAVNLDYSYRSHEQFQLEASPWDQPAYGLLGARLTVRGVGERWSIALFGTNLTDERYRTAGRNGISQTGIAYSSIALPRQIGFELKAGF